MFWENETASAAENVLIVAVVMMKKRRIVVAVVCPMLMAVVRAVKFYVAAGTAKKEGRWRGKRR